MLQYFCARGGRDGDGEYRYAVKGIDSAMDMDRDMNAES